MATQKVKPKEAIILCKGHHSSILNCIGEQSESNFYESWSPFSNGKTPYCKNCIEKIYQYYLGETQSEETSLFYTLAKIDIPFIREMYEFTINKVDKNGNAVPLTVSGYISELKRRATTKRELWTDFSATDIGLEEVDDKIKTREEKAQELAQWEKDWGKQEDIADYEFLEMTFSRYTKGVEFINSQQEDLYRDLCRDRLLLRKINDGRYSGEETIDKVQNRIAKTMSTLKVDEFESNKPKTISEQSLFERIRLCDENNVTDIYSNPTKHYDLNKIAYYNEKFSLRPLLNMLVGHRDFNINIDDVDQYDLENGGDTTEK